MKPIYGVGSKNWIFLWKPITLFFKGNMNCIFYLIFYSLHGVPKTNSYTIYSEPVKMRLKLVLKCYILSFLSTLLLLQLIPYVTSAPSKNLSPELTANFFKVTSYCQPFADNDSRTIFCCSCHLNDLSINSMDLSDLIRHWLLTFNDFRLEFLY